MAHITITYERVFTDGNYGKEGLVCDLREDVASIEAGAEQIAQLVNEARAVVLTTLAASANSTVAAAARREAVQHGLPIPSHADGTQPRPNIYPLTR